MSVQGWPNEVPRVNCAGGLLGAPCSPASGVSDGSGTTPGCEALGPLLVGTAGACSAPAPQQQPSSKQAAKRDGFVMINTVRHDRRGADAPSSTGRHSMGQHRGQLGLGFSFPPEAFCSSIATCLVIQKGMGCAALHMIAGSFACAPSGWCPAANASGGLHVAV